MKIHELPQNSRGCGRWKSRTRKFASRLNGGRPGEDGGEWHLKFTSRLKEGRARLNVGLIVSVRVKVDSLGLRKLKNPFTLYFYRILIMITLSMAGEVL